MPRATDSRVASPIFHEPSFSDLEPVFGEQPVQPIPPYFSEPHPSDNGTYQQIEQLLTKDVVAFERSRAADGTCFTLEQAYGSYGPAVLQQIQSSQQLVFDILGDSGASDQASFAHEIAVAKAVSNYIQSTGGAARPSFMFHVGDLVYSFGEARYYYDQFYSPFRDYAAPIIAIPGNHDSFIVPGTAPEDEPLVTFQRNFCSQAPTVTADAKSLHRTAMTQPGAYFTLDAPYIRIIGLFSNALEDPGLISSEGGRWSQVPDFQLAYLKAQLQACKEFPGFVLIATHHPAFCFSPENPSDGTSGGHGSSPNMLAQIDAICSEVGVYPHAFLSGHAHNYQHYNRQLSFAGKLLNVPFLVVGASGHHVTPLVRGKGGNPGKEPSRTEPTNVSYMDRGKVFSGTSLVLQKYQDQDYGFMRATVTPDALQFDYFLADSGGQPFDTVIVKR